MEYQGTILGDLFAEHDVLNLHWAEFFDRVRYTPEQRGDVVLTAALWVGKAEVPDGPGRRGHPVAVL